MAYHKYNAWGKSLILIYINTIVALAKLTREAEEMGMVDIDQIIFIEEVSLIFSFLIVLGAAIAIGFLTFQRGSSLLKSLSVAIFSFLLCSVVGPIWFLMDIVCNFPFDMLTLYLKGAVALWIGFFVFIFPFKKGAHFLDCVAISLPVVFFTIIGEMTWFPIDFIYFPFGLSLLVILYFSCIFGTLYLATRLFLRANYQ